MSAAQQLVRPSTPSKGINKRLDLQCDIVEWLKKEGIGWNHHQVESHGAVFVCLLTDVLWYLDPHRATLKGRYCSIPELFVQFTGYSNPGQHGHKAPQLAAATLQSLSKQLDQVCVQLWLEKHKALHSAMVELADRLN